VFNSVSHPEGMSQLPAQVAQLGSEQRRHDWLIRRHWGQRHWCHIPLALFSPYMYGMQCVIGASSASSTTPTRTTTGGT
jgi:hypothetical protein